MKTIIFLLHFLYISTMAYSQTVYGITGMVKTPTAYSLESGEMSVGFNLFSDQFQKRYGKETFQQWSANINVGFLSFFEAGIRLVGVPKISIQDSNLPYDYYIDRNINFKFILLREKDNLPQISFGMQDAIGTRIFNSTYFVASKTFNIQEKTEFKFSFGYGTKLSQYIFDEPNNYRLSGFFGGTEIGLYNFTSIMLEYDAKDVNAGISIRPVHWLNLFGYYTSLKDLGCGISFKFEI